jgi:hypothetical protein
LQALKYQLLGYVVGWGENKDICDLNFDRDNFLLWATFDVGHELLYIIVL